MPGRRSPETLGGRTPQEWDALLADEYERCRWITRIWGVRGRFLPHSDQYPHIGWAHVRWRAERVAHIRAALDENPGRPRLPSPSVLEMLPAELRPRAPRSIEVLNGTTALTQAPRASTTEQASSEMPEALTDLTFGVELEILPPTDNYGPVWGQLTTKLTESGIRIEEERLTHTTQTWWKLVHDGSLSYGGREIVSPILKGPSGISDLKKVCAVLTEMGFRVNRTCGFHVHVGMQDEASTLPVARRILQLYAEAEPVIDTIVAPSRRGDRQGYARSLRGCPLMDQADTLQELFRRAGGTRYMKVNLDAYWRHGTIEFRQHQGTIDGDKASAWVLLCLKIVDWARGQDDLPTEVNGLPQLAEVVRLTPEERGYFERRARQLANIRTMERS